MLILTITNPSHHLQAEKMDIMVILALKEYDDFKKECEHDLKKGIVSKKDLRQALDEKDLSQEEKKA